jgi:hypothetical protein
MDLMHYINPLMATHLGFTNDCKYNLFKQTD